MPKRLTKEEATATETYAKFIAEPFETGYGHTIGNSLRRVLLSSLEGAAITSVRIDGAMHEFATIEGVVEEAAAFARCMAAEGAEQCGFCTPGLTMTVLALRRELEAPDEEAINRYLAGNLCRCSGYAGQLRAIKTFLGVG